MAFQTLLARRLAFGSGSGMPPAVKVAIAAVALSLTVMLAAIAIVAGFRSEITQRIYGFNAHLTLHTQPISPEEDGWLKLSPSLVSILDDVPWITSYRLESSTPAIFKTDNDFKGIYVRTSTDPQSEPVLLSSLVEGTLPDADQPYQIAISRQAAQQLRLNAGDTLPTYFLSDDIRVRALRVSAIYDTHFDSFDDVYAFAPQALNKDLIGLSPDKGTSLRIFTDTPKAELLPSRAAELSDILNYAYAEGRIPQQLYVENAFDSAAAYFSWLSLLDTNVLLILIIMSVVAAVTLIGAMLITTLDQRRLIGTLRSLGASAASIRTIFLLLTIRIALIGLLIGNLVTIPFLWLQQRYHFLPLDAENYYIDYVPINLSWVEILLLNAALIVVIATTLILPSRIAANTSPTQALRYES